MNGAESDNPHVMRVYSSEHEILYVYNLRKRTSVWFLLPKHT